MKTFVVTNRALRHDSSYYDVVAVKLSLLDAQAVRAEKLREILNHIENGEKSEFTLETTVIIEFNKELIIGDNKTGAFEIFEITEIDTDQ